MPLAGKWGDNLLSMVSGRTSDIVFYGKILNVCPNLYDNLKSPWVKYFNGAKANTSSADFAANVKTISDITFTLVDGWYVLKDIPRIITNVRKGLNLFKVGDRIENITPLRSLGFEVILKHNISQDDFENTLSDFTARLRSYAVGLFYFAGHGFKGSDNANYLMSVDMHDGLNETLAKKKSLSLTDIMNSMKEANSRTNILLVDACRDNPFRSWGRSDKTGLGSVSAPKSVIAFFAASPGQEASENPGARNGLFTQELLCHLKTPNLELIAIFKNTARAVSTQNKNQTPYQAGFITDDFYFSVKDTPSQPDPNEEAKKKDAEIARLKEALAKKNTSTTITSPSGGRGAKFLDLPFSEMVYVEGGTFEMGDTRNEGESNEKPVHNVTVSSFLMGKYEVTQRQWTDIMGSNPSYFKNCDDCPVENVSWDDIREFLKRLNLRTGVNYRLPTEAEWEYAAGGGSTNRTRFGNGKSTIAPSEANFDASAAYKKGYSEMGEYRRKTMRVGSFIPNQLGIYDLSGNVWEWCADWYSAYSNTSQTNPTGRDTGTYRVLRGGSWFITPNSAGVANRSSSAPGNRGSTCGFRLVSQAP